MMEVDSELEQMKKEKIQRLKDEVKQKFMIPKQNLNIGSCLGKGNFGEVRRGKFIEVIKRQQFKETDVAIKELSPKRANDEKSHEDFITEAINMSKLAEIMNDNIIRFIGVCIDEESDKLMIITELAALKDLKSYLIQEKDTMTTAKLVDFCAQICNGMIELESRYILHRDLALRNILVVSRDKVKISDFGLSRLSDYYKSEGGKYWPLKWYAPESVCYLKFTSKSDVWSFGVTMWEIFTYGADPYPGITTYNEILDYILKGNRLPQPEDCPDDIYKLMCQCWLEDKNSRPSFYILYNCYFNKLKEAYPNTEE